MEPREVQDRIDRRHSTSHDKVFLFCTSWAPSTSVWNSRFRTWIEHNIHSPLVFDRIFIFDDCSPIMPEWNDTYSTRDQSTVKEENLVNIVSFPHRIGRESVWDCEGWYRSFSSAINYAFQNGYKKIIHIESDAYLISDQAFETVNRFQDGWMTFWSEKHGFPEMAIQVIAGASLADAAKCFSRDYEWLRGKNHERLLPFTLVDRDLVGERYEDFKIKTPLSADWTTQTVVGITESNQWWLRSDGINTRDLRVGLEISALKSGWQGLEDGLVWSCGSKSAILLPPPLVDGRYGLVLELSPALAESLFCYQSVEVVAGQKHLACLLLRERTTIILNLGKIDGCEVGGIEILLRYENPFRPSDLDSRNGDKREIAVALHRASIFLL